MTMLQKVARIIEDAAEGLLNGEDVDMKVVNEIAREIIALVESRDTIGTYACTSESNYGLVIHIVNATDEEEAKKIAIAAGAWECEVSKLDLSQYGVLFKDASR